jgi:drug/metabolite transporter (DMT)-like permease
VKDHAIPPRAILLLATLTVGWGITWPFMKIALNEIQPWTFRGILAPTSMVILILMARASAGGFRMPRGQWGSMVLVAACTTTGWQILSALGLRLMGAGQATIVAYTMPLWAFLFGILLMGERPSAAKFIGLALGIGGVAVLVSEDMGTLAAAPMGAVFMLASAVIWGLGTVLQKKANWPLNASSIAAWLIIIGGPPMTVIALIVEGVPTEPVSAKAVGAMLFMLFVPTVFCRYAWVRIVSLVPITVSSVGILLAPVVSVIFSNWMLDEPLGWRETSALFLVCGAIALVITPAGGRRRWLR